MAGLNRNTPDFGKRKTANPLAIVAVLLLLAVGLLSAWREWDVAALRSEVTQLDDRLANQRMLHERELRRMQAQSPEERKVDALLSAQSAEDRLRPKLLRAIEAAWAPRIAVMNLKIELAGKAASLELMTADLSEIFAFAARMNDPDSGMRATVMRHGIKAGDPNLATMATVRVELR
ncbi:hypothetical protein [Achromobacter sp. PAB15]|uniref:hypothetical protein n=1 Tax=Achromobacter sp. PAB15 TaxID=3233048 RepID=UPI003F8DE6B1